MISIYEQEINDQVRITTYMILHFKNSNSVNAGHIKNHRIRLEMMKLWLQVETILFG